MHTGKSVTLEGRWRGCCSEGKGQDGARGKAEVPGIMIAYVPLRGVPLPDFPLPLSPPLPLPDVCLPAFVLLRHQALP